MTNIISSQANLFVYSNVATSLSSSLSYSGLENDTGPIQNFTAVSLSSGIFYYMKGIYQV